MFSPNSRVWRKVIKINAKSSLPKYRQIIESIHCAIESGSLKRGDKIPSINQVCSDFNLSRDTVLFAFGKLKAKGVILSQPGKGYFIATTENNRLERVFLLLDELNHLKVDLYNSLVETIKSKATVEMYFHNNNIKVFKNLIAESTGHFTSYIIMPSGFENINHLISKLPSDRVYILDRLKTELKNYPVVYQDFDKDFYDALTEGALLLKKYRKLVLVHPPEKEPEGRINGFERFCKEKKLSFQVIHSLDGTRPGLYEAWFVVSDRDLVQLVQLTKRYKYKLGKKFGIVSFNDSLLKEVVACGITTVSTDYAEMGKNLGNMLLTHKNGQVRNPSKLVIRKSL